MCSQKEEERLRASIRRESQQRRVREKAHQRGLSSNFLEGEYDEDDDEGGVSIKALKEKYKGSSKRKALEYTSVIKYCLKLLLQSPIITKLTFPNLQCVTDKGGTERSM